jgi:hypothetical protein
MDRKALKRQYKETRRPMGVFRIRNTLNDKSLVGSSIDVNSILNRHRAQLKLGVHMNRPLQEDWNEFGSDAFTFEVLDTITPPENQAYDPSSDLRALEELWLDRLSPYGERGYNSKPR